MKWDIQHIFYFFYFFLTDGDDDYDFDGSCDNYGDSDDVQMTTVMMMW